MEDTIENIKQLENFNLFPTSCEINEKGHLTIGKIDCIELAKQYGTPLYIIDKKTLTGRINQYVTSLKKHYEKSLILYASKSFTCTEVFKIANDSGLGIDVVSGGELYTALKVNYKKENIYFHGNNKSEEEIAMAIKSGIGKIICDNFNELEIIQETAKGLNKTQEILIRLTPGIECHTHEYIKTGHLDSKFGFDLDYIDEVLEKIKSSTNIKLKGMHAHIGSQIFELKPYSDVVEILLEQFAYAKSKYGFELDELNIGGGIGISYTTNDDPILIEDWAKTVSTSIKECCKKYNLNEPKLICEPGRSISGPSGITLYKAGSSKQVPNGKKYISVDGGMADNPRPITYQAKYEAVVVNKMLEKKKEKVTIAGKYCESGDILIKEIELPSISKGDIIAVLNTGAYNYSMSSNYNMMPRPACVMVDDGKAEVIIERETFEDLIRKHK
jgi:diaminopimelate decarboxylase